MVQTADTPVAFNPLEPGFIASPYDQYARLRDADPVHWSELIQGWVLTRYADVLGVLRDPSVSSDREKAKPNPIIDAERGRSSERAHGSSTVVLTDEPDHTRLRRLIQAPFSPRAVKGLAPMITRHVNEALDAALAGADAAGEIDLIADFAYPLPVVIFCEMLGIPDEDSPKFKYWCQSVARSLDPVMSDEERAVCMQGVDEMYDYLAAQAEIKRRNPADDIMSDLVHAEEEGERLTHEELMGQLITLYVAGHEPTAGAIGLGMVGLSRHPDQFALLKSDRSLLKNAVVELLRYDGPNQFVRRVATTTIEIDDHEIEPGDVIYPSPAAANRDPAHWGPDADRVRIERADAASHVQFGSGIHSCLGAHLARLQIEICFAALLDRLDNIELAGEPGWSPRMVIRSIDNLPIAFTLR